MNDININALVQHSPKAHVNNLFKSCLQLNHSLFRKIQVFSVKSSKTALQKKTKSISGLDVMSGPRPESSVAIVRHKS